MQLGCCLWVAHARTVLDGYSFTDKRRVTTAQDGAHYDYHEKKGWIPAANAR